jgi:hypothetical protein
MVAFSSLPASILGNVAESVRVVRQVAGRLVGNRGRGQRFARPVCLHASGANSLSNAADTLQTNEARCRLSHL